MDHHVDAAGMDASLERLLSDLITAYHILHSHEVLDEHGQISVRNPKDPSTFFISCSPAVLVSAKSDLSQWYVADGSPVSEPYHGCDKVQEISSGSEHYAHSSVYNMYPGVQSVIHSHCLSAIVYGLCHNWTSMLQPSYLMAGFLGTSPPIFDTAKYYDSLPRSHPQNLLVNNEFLGDALAELFHKSDEADTHIHNGLPDGMSDGFPDLPEQKVVFMRGHGYTTWAESIADVVWRAIHIRRDADIQTTAMNQRDSTDLEIVYLSEREARDCERTINHCDPKHWLSWVTEAERSGRYRNDLKMSIMSASGR